MKKQILLVAALFAITTALTASDSAVAPTDDTASATASATASDSAVAPTDDTVPNNNNRLRARNTAKAAASIAIAALVFRNRASIKNAAQKAKAKVTNGLQTLKSKISNLFS